MRHRLRTIALACLAAMAVGHVDFARATVCNIPLAIGQAGAAANVLILLDSSGSMNEALVSSAYNPNTNYPGNFSKNQSYNITVSGNYAPSHFKNTYPATPTAYLVTSDKGEAGVYYGNYLNWVYFTATAAQRAAIPVVTRIQSAKSVVNTVLGSVGGCRFGVEIFNGGNGGTILCPFGTSIASMQSSVTNVDANAMTPLAESMVTALNYFATTGVNAPIQATCQKNFIIVVTDGLPTSDTTVPSYIKDANHNGYYLDDVAAYLYRNDLRSDMDGIQNVATFTIGFNVDATATALLQSTADQGGGSSFSINDGAGLMAALTEDFNTIAARISAGSAVSVVASENRTNNRLYRARYESQTWKGYLEAFQLPYHSGNAAQWEAGSMLSTQDPATRRIMTSTTGTNTVAFSVANAATLQTLLGAASVPAATNTINYELGAAVTGTRDRGGWKLGDIVDAAPVAVGHPNGFNSFLNYANFRAQYANRQEVVYVDANDGMLHCFDATSGTELWGYVPKNQLPRLSELMDPAYCHDYFLNMTPLVCDVYMNSAWKTIVIGGDAQGGNGLFALDVTSVSADTVHVLWDIDNAALKGSWNTPTLVRDRTRNAYVLAVGTGYDPTVAQTNLLVLNPADGTTLSTIALGSTVGGNKTTKATAVDRDFDGYDDLLYLGDLAGNIWRVDMTTNPWSVTKLFACGQPIQAAPVVTLDNLGRAMIFFGTGQYMTASDPGTTTQQSIYGVLDDNLGHTYSPSDLVNQTTIFQGLTSGSHGWRMDLVQHTGERVTHAPALINGTLYITSFLPSASACTAGGQSWLYSLDYKDGSAPDHSNGTANNVTDGRVQSMGDGILADPSIDLVNEQLILQSTNAVLLTQDIDGGIKRLIVRSWRQKWN